MAGGGATACDRGRKKKRKKRKKQKGVRRRQSRLASKKQEKETARKKKHQRAQKQALREVAISTDDRRTHARREGWAGSTLVPTRWWGGLGICDGAVYASATAPMGWLLAFATASSSLYFMRSALVMIPRTWFLSSVTTRCRSPKVVNSR